MSANRQLKRHHACHECRIKKLKCSGDRPICDGCKRKQDHYAANGSRRPVPECTYDFAPGEEVWVHWNTPSTRPTNGKSVSKRTPSPPSDPKFCRPLTPNKPPAQVQPPVMIQRQMKPQELPLLPVGVTETAPYPDHFPTHFSQWNSFFATGIPYTHNNSMTLNGLSHNTALLMDHTINEPFFDVDPHGQHLQGSASTSSSDTTTTTTTTNEFSYPTPSYTGSLSSVTLLSNGMYRW